MMSTITQQSIFKILIVIDTVEIQKRYTNPNINYDEPIKIDESTWFAIYPKKTNHKLPDSLHSVFFQAKKNHKISISGISIDGDSSDSIMLNEIENFNTKKETSNLFTSVCTSRNIVTSYLNTDNDLAITNTNQNFIWFESTIASFGKNKFKIIFSVYNLDNNGNQQNLYGYFWFPLEINIRKKSIFN
ncbi:AidA/PixA family protein [Flavobacterium sp. 316]|uniref:AidA/PixA family protein n=1 Tax=Flavobacterium sp. 316 TaxID=1603293 RepID=UPI0009E511F7|nr:AidA/PixA family protein [Flavobacterium sp. 316]